MQFYPDGVVTDCTPNGGFVLHFQPNTYTVCSPVWSIRTTGQKPNYHEPAAFNAMLTTGAKHAPLVMHAGDTIRLHFHVVSQAEGWHIDVLDETTGGSGTIVLNGARGPILPAFSTQTLGNSLNWGSVYDTPNSFVWEIGHTSPYSSPASKSASRVRRTAPPTTSRPGSASRRSASCRPASAPATQRRKAGRSSATSAATQRSTSTAEQSAGPSASIRGSRSETTEPSATAPITQGPRTTSARARSSLPQRTATALSSGPDTLYCANQIVP